MFDDPEPYQRQRRQRVVEEPDDFEEEEDEAGEDPALDYFRAEGWISHVVREVKSGKEATVYCCAAGPSAGVALLAAKLYRAREHRSFRHASVYNAGRVVVDKRLGRAFAKGTSKGQEVQQALWIGHEWETLSRLHALGADVPTPVARTDGALLMSYHGDAEAPAPRLQDVALRPDEAHYLFERLMRNVQLFLANDTVHGDLSAFNVLYWQGQATVIDFPQAVDPRTNPHALELLRRDVANLCRYFGRFGVRADATRIADGLWRRFLRAEL